MNIRKPPLSSATFRRLTLLLVALLACCAFHGPAAAAGPAAIRAGAAAVDITPEEWPVPLIGSFAYQAADSAHDPLHARALVLEAGDTRIAIVVVDSCYVQREYLDQAKELARAATGIPENRILISATHTHTAPPANARYGSEPELAYQKLLIRRIAESIERAAAALQPAQIGWASYDEPGEVFNRRWFLQPGTIPPDPFGGTTDIVKMNPGAGNKNLISPAGPTDPQVFVLSVRTAKGRPLALLANYSLHYVGGVPPKQVSADYYGEFARLMKNRLSGDRPEESFVAILSNGTSGDINNISVREPRPPREPFEQIRMVAGTVADAAFRAYQQIDHREQVDLAMEEREITLQRRVPTQHQIARARATLKIEDEKELPKLAKSYAQRTLDQAEEGDTMEIKLQTIRIGDLGIAAIPFEVFSEIGLEIKERSPLESTFTIELANGGSGYLPTAAQHKLGGYETWLTTNRVQPESARVIMDTILELFEELSAKRGE